MKFHTLSKTQPPNRFVRRNIFILKYRFNNLWHGHATLHASVWRELWTLLESVTQTETLFYINMSFLLNNSAHTYSDAWFMQPRKDRVIWQRPIFKKKITRRCLCADGEFADWQNTKIERRIHEEWTFLVQKILIKSKI